MTTARSQLYDSIGRKYSEFRQPDPIIQQAIEDGLGDAESVVNVGAGTGSYEPTGRRVIAVEISTEMIRQRPTSAAPAVQATAMALPFKDDAFDASLAVLTIHHWRDQRRGLAELRRVARKRVVVLTWDPSFPGFWLTDYFPEVLELDRSIFPPISKCCQILGKASVVEVPIPANCADGFGGAYWRRPTAVLNERVRGAISTFSKIDDVTPRLRRLESDLNSGVWHRRYGHIMDRSALDLGYRLIVASCA